ncbi:MAG: hypothetical protein KDI19_05440 [Pseudomonadales bacterium]|nr:hypothetical protein [Pseudomonadales bacterium]
MQVTGTAAGREVAREADHARLAMEAARKMSRLRRKSQKEKTGHVVCHHLLCLLNPEADVPARKKLPAAETLQAAREVELPRSDDRQISLGF